MGCYNSKIQINSNEKEYTKSLSTTQFSFFNSNRSKNVKNDIKSDKKLSSNRIPSNSIRSIILKTPTSSLRISPDFSFQYILKDPIAREKFKSFLVAQHAIENMMFYEVIYYILLIIFIILYSFNIYIYFSL